MATTRRTKAELLAEIEDLWKRLAELEIGKGSKAETVLRESEEKYRTLLENLKDSIITVDLDGSIQFANQASAELTGYSIEEGIGMKVTDIIPQKYWPVSFAMLQKAERGERVPYFEIEIIRKDGRIIPVESGGQAIVRDGKVVGIQIITRDISERKQAEEVVRESEGRYRELADSIADIFFAMDKDLKYTYWNRASEELTGIPARDAIGKHILDIFPDSDTTRKAIEVYQDVLESRRPRTFVNEYHLGEQDYIFEISAYPSGEGISVFTRDITQRRATESALAKAEHRYRTLFESLPVGVGLATTDGRVLAINHAMQRITGYSLEDFNQLNLADTYADSQERERLLAQLETTGAADGFEVMLRRSDGTPYQARLTIREITLGDARALMTVCDDVTERKLIQQTLQKSEAKLRRIIEHSTDGIYLVDESGTVIEWNRGLENITGLTKREVLGRLIWDVLIKLRLPEQRSADAQRKFTAEFLRYLRSGRAAWLNTPVEQEIQRSDGTRRIVQSMRYAIETREGWMLGGIDRDMTTIRQSEQAYWKSEERYRELVENAGIGIVVDDLEGDIGFFNEEFARLFGYTPREMKEQSLDTLVHPDDLERVRGIHRNRIRGEDVPSRYEFKGIRKDGSTVYLEVAASLREEDRVGEGITLGTRSYLWNVTDRKEAEDALRALSARIERAREQERAAIAREIHDELSQNLTAVKIDLAELQGELKSDQAALHELAGSITKLVEDTSQRLKRISAELRPGLLDDLGIAAAIEWQANEFQRISGVLCSLSLDPPELVLDHQSTTGLFRVFQEILSNVHRHAGATKVDVKVRGEAGQVILEVSDNGGGIDQKAISSPTSLGLIGMKERINLLGGDFKVSGSKGRGTRVMVVLPLTTPHEPAGT